MLARQSLFSYLDSLGIKHVTHEHAPAFTVKDAHDILAGLPAHGPCKNLFLKDKKNRFYLVVALFQTNVVLKDLARLLAAPDLHFASPGQLMNILGLTPGSVTPFGLVHDTEHTVTVVLDKTLMDHDLIGIHPLSNNATTFIAPHDLVTFVKSCGNRLEWFNVALGGQAG